MSALTLDAATLAAHCASFAVLARASYGEGASVEDQVRAMGLEVESEWHQGSLDAYAVGCEGMLAIVGPGTQNWGQLKLDLDAALVPAEALAAPDVVRVHQGVDQAWRAMRPWVEQERALVGDTREFVYVGHSLFGMIAHRACIDIPPDACWTFGAGRSGDVAFALCYDRLGIPTARVVHERDVIPTIPYGAGYVHVDGAIALADSGALVPQADASGAPGAHPPTSAWQQWLADLDGQAERDHRIATYVLAAGLAQRLTAALPTVNPAETLP